MRVLLVVPPFPESLRLGSAGAVASSYHSIGLASIAAAVRQAGHHVRILECAGGGLSFGQAKQALRLFGPDLVGIQTFHHNAGAAYQLAHLTRVVCPGARVVLGGIGATMFPEEAVVQPGVDFAIVGEGELPLVELLAALEQGRPTEQVSDLVYRDGDRLVRTGRRAKLPELDSLPLPALDLLPMERYHGSAQTRGRRTLHLMTSRGCPYACGYCATPLLFRRRCRTASPERVLAEIDLLRSHCGADAIQFYDDCFTLDRGRAIDLCRAFREAKMDLPWSIFTRADLVDPELLAELAAAGCYQVFYGVESGSPRVLEQLGKGESLEQIARAFRFTRAAGLESFASLQIGLPGETVADARETIRFILEADPDYILYHRYTPWPGTPLYETALAEGRLLEIDRSRFTINWGLTYLPDGMQREEAERLVAEAMRRFYLRPRYLLRWAGRAYRLPLGNLLRLAAGAPRMLLRRRSG